MSPGPRPASRSACFIAWIAPAPDGSGAVMWCASQLKPDPEQAARGAFPFRLLADSSTSIPAPSPKIVPSRSAANGWMLVGVRVLRAEWPRYFILSSVSVPPQMTASYPSNTIISLAIPMAFVPPAQAVETVNASPRMPNRSASSSAKPDRSSAVFSEASAFSRTVSTPSLTRDIPRETPTTSPTFLFRRSASLSSLCRSASSIASFANKANRELIPARRACSSVCGLNRISPAEALRINSRLKPRIGEIPLRPATSPSQNCGTFSPRAVMHPRPVTIASSMVAPGSFPGRPAQPLVASGVDVFPDVVRRGPDRLHVRRRFLGIDLEAVSLFDERDQLDLSDGVETDIGAQRIRVLYFLGRNLDKEVLDQDLLQLSGNFFFVWVHKRYSGFLTSGRIAADTHDPLRRTLRRALPFATIVAVVGAQLSFIRLLVRGDSRLPRLICCGIRHFFLGRAEYLAFVIIVVFMFKAELTRDQMRGHAPAAEFLQFLGEIFLRRPPGFDARAEPLLPPAFGLRHRHFPHRGMRRDALFDQRRIDHAPAKLELAVFAAQAV